MPHVQNELEWNWKGQRVSLKTQLQLALSQRPPSRHSLKLVFCLLFFLLLCFDGCFAQLPTAATALRVQIQLLQQQATAEWGIWPDLEGLSWGRGGAVEVVMYASLAWGLVRFFFSRSLPSAAPPAVQERRAKSESVPREAFPAAWNQNKMSKTERSNRYNKHNRLCFGMCAVCNCMCINIFIFWFI